MLISGQPAVTDHLGEPLVLSSESKAHAHAVAPPKSLKIQKPRPHSSQPPPVRRVASPPPESPPAAIPKRRAQVPISPTHSPSGRPEKRAKVDHQFGNARPQKKLPRAHAVQGSLQLKRKLPGDTQPHARIPSGTSHLRGAFAGPQPPAFGEAGPSSLVPSIVPSVNGYGQTAAAPIGYAPQMQQMYPGMYPPQGQGQMGQQWPQQQYQQVWDHPYMQTMPTDWEWDQGLQQPTDHHQEWHR